jgi:hypothetical protein
VQRVEQVRYVSREACEKAFNGRIYGSFFIAAEGARADSEPAFSVLASQVSSVTLGPLLENRMNTSLGDF